MSDERKEWLLKHVEYVFNACRLCSKFLGCECSKCPKGEEACDQGRLELKRLVQQKPEIDDMDEYVEDKAREMFNSGRRLVDFEAFVRRVISDVRGGGLKILGRSTKYPHTKREEEWIRIK